MIEVQDMPLSDPEYEDDDENDGGEEDELDGIAEEEENDETTDLPEPTDPTPPSEPFDEKAFQAKISDRLEKIRLSKALGNDEDYISPPSGKEDKANNSDSDSSEDLLSDGPPQSDFTAYTRTRVHHARPTAKKLDTNPLSLKNVVARQVEKELGNQQKTSVKGKVGKAKGHKWKANPNYAVGGKGDGWQ